MWCWRRMENIKWSEKVTNEKVLERIGGKRTLLNTILSRKVNWIGHILRGNCLLHNVPQWHQEGGNFFSEYDQSICLFYVGYYLEVSSSLLYVQKLLYLVSLVILHSTPAPHLEALQILQLQFS